MKPSIPRRRVLALLASLAALAPGIVARRGLAGTAAALPGTAAFSGDAPQSELLRELDVDEWVEPALIFVPSLSPAMGGKR